MAVLVAPRPARARHRGMRAVLAGLVGLADLAAHGVTITCLRHGHALLCDSNGGHLCRRCGRTWRAP